MTDKTISVPIKLPPYPSIYLRVNRAEYNNTIRDLMGVDFFESDDAGYGFDNIGDVLSSRWYEWKSISRRSSIEHLIS